MPDFKEEQVKNRAKARKMLNFPRTLSLNGKEVFISPF